MSDLLMIMNARAIKPCIEQFQALDIDKAWLTGYTENQLCEAVRELVRDTAYTNYVMCSDDFLVSQKALDEVLGALAEGHPVVTGYAPLDQTDHRVNITKSPLVVEGQGIGYDWYEKLDVLSSPTALVRTGFAGMTLTGMSRELWQQFPFNALPGGYGPPADGCCSDLLLCLRLQLAGIPIVAPRSAFVDHIKAEWNQLDTDPERRLLIGEVPAETRLEVTAAAQASPAASPHSLG